MIKYKKYNQAGDAVILSIEFETPEQLIEYEASVEGKEYREMLKLILNDSYIFTRNEQADGVKY